MSATSAAASLSSSSSVAGQQSPALKASSDYEESSLYSSPDNDWDMQGSEHVQNDIIEYYPSESPPQTPGLSWDSRPSSASLSTPAFKSVFDETEDIIPISANLAVIIEEDGAQTVLIPADNPFFNTPSPRKPFGFAPFSTDLLAENEAEMPSNLPSAVAPHKIKETAPSNAGSPDHQRANSKKLTLLVDAAFLDTTFEGEVMISSAVFSTPSIRFGDDASWAPKDFMSGPDVPLDCIYTAGDISPMAEHWGGAWSPIVRSPFRSAPCV